MTKPLRILVVDDNQDHADSMAELFALEGHAVTVAYSGEDAIAAYDRHVFDIAFMDVMMPGRNGVESFLEIKRAQPDVKVYMMTGYSIDQLLQQAIDNGALGVLGKPLDFNQVMRVIDAARPAGIVVIAQDDPGLGPTLQASLLSQGGTCALFGGGRDALARAAEGRMDVLILDHHLPLIDSIDVYARRRSARRAVPTVMLAACSDRHQAPFDALTDVEVTGILTKPFDFDVLLEKLDRLAT